MSPHLDERGRRLFGANAALTIWHGGMILVKEATELSYSTSKKGMEELKSKNPPLAQKRIRRSGGGRKTKTTEYPSLTNEISSLIEPQTLGAHIPQIH